MKIKAIIGVLLFVIIIITACDNDNNDDTSEKMGMLKFKTLNPIVSVKDAIFPKSTPSNPPLVGDTTATNTTSFLLCVGDVWVSQGEVKDGEPDDLDWVRITSITNTETALFEDISFPEIELPQGTYRSIKIIFRNVFYRYCQLISDPAVAYELLETMGSYEDPCNENDSSWAETNYFGPDGNHILNADNLFELEVPGEKIAGFYIEENKTAVVSWRLGAGATEPCTTYLIDNNGNRVWDCGIDEMEFECPPENIYMWDFVIEYQ